MKSELPAALNTKSCRKFYITRFLFFSFKNKQMIIASGKKGKIQFKHIYKPHMGVKIANY